MHRAKRARSGSTRGAPGTLAPPDHPSKILSSSSPSRRSPFTAFSIKQDCRIRRIYRITENPVHPANPVKFSLLPENDSKTRGAEETEGLRFAAAVLYPLCAGVVVGRAADRPRDARCGGCRRAGQAKVLPRHSIVALKKTGGVSPLSGISAVAVSPALKSSSDSVTSTSGARSGHANASTAPRRRTSSTDAASVYRAILIGWSY